MSRSRRRIVGWLVPCALLNLFGGAALAEPSPDPTLTVSAGVGAANEYEGANEFQALPLLSFDYVGRKVAVRSRGLGLEVDMTPSPKFQFGPTANYRFGRDSDVDDPAVSALPEVDDALEVGFFASTGIPVRALGVDGPEIVFGRVSFAHDILDAHGGYLISGSIGVARPLAPKLRGVFSVSTTYASAAYMSTFFGVSPADAALSGLPPFDADAGFKDVGVTGVLSYGFTDRWSVSLLGRYAFLLGDAASSPVVADVGSRSQFFGGVTINYRAF